MKKTICLILLFALLLSGCGSFADAPETTKGYEPDYPVTSAEESGTEEEILAARRKTVVDEMRTMMTTLWTPSETFSYSKKNASDGIEADKAENADNVATFYKGQIYQGIPYTHGSGSLYSFLSFAESEENGVYTLDGLTDQYMTGNCSGSVNRRARIGNDCADSIFWAWGRVSNSISFGGTVSMTEPYGCLKVGDYAFSGSNYRDILTTDVCEATGQQQMYDCYAQMLGGDAVVQMRENGGHAAMVTDVHIEYNDDGTINGQKSYASIIEQSSTWEVEYNTYYNETVGAEVCLLEEVDEPWTFQLMYDTGYLPVTCKELVDPSPRAEVTVTDYTDTPTADNMFKGVVKASYRISSVTVTIADKKGNTVQTATCFGKQEEMYSINLYRFTDVVEKEVMQGNIDLNELEEGTYRVTFACRVSTGDNIIFRDFEFTK